MGDGWETKRRRGPGYDWIILKLGSPGTIRKIEVDTNHFKGNYPDTLFDRRMRRARCFDSRSWPAKIRDWSEILPKTKLQADKRHFFERKLSSIE